MRQRSREQVIGGALALLVTAIIVIEFLVDSKTGMSQPAQIVYVDSWSENRTDAEIKADQKKDQEKRKQAQLEKQREFQKLANAFGIE